MEDKAFLKGDLLLMKQICSCRSKFFLLQELIRIEVRPKVKRTVNLPESVTICLPSKKTTCEKEYILPSDYSDRSCSGSEHINQTQLNMTVHINTVSLQR